MSDNKYKTTLNLPDTKFPMRANLPQREPGMLDSWYKEDLYGAIRAARRGRKSFILHDGPPYANGNIHLGHSVNKILKDIILKAKTLSGYDAPISRAGTATVSLLSSRLKRRSESPAAR